MTENMPGILYPAAYAEGPRPGLLLIHGGSGLDDHARGQAERYSRLGYPVLACDLFGPEVAGDRARTLALITALRDDPDLLVARGGAALEALLSSPATDGRAAAIGFC